MGASCDASIINTENGESVTVMRQQKAVKYRIK